MVFIVLKTSHQSRGHVKIEHLSERIAWNDLLFVERDKTPSWAIEVNIQSVLPNQPESSS